MPPNIPLQFACSLPAVIPLVGAYARGDAERLRRPRSVALRPWSLLPSARGRSVGAFPSLPFFGRFRGVCAVGSVLVRAWRLSGLYGLIFAPCAVLGCALRVPLPFSLDFSPILARFAAGDI